MKKFTFCTEPTDKTQPAVIDINNTAPMDFVGRLCVSKVKIPRNTLPIALVPPMSYEFTAEERSTIDTYGKTPTEMYFIVFSQVHNNSSSPVCGGNTQQYVKTRSNFQLITGETPNFELTNRECFTASVFTYWIDEHPRWKMLENGNYILTNPSKAIYSWCGENMDLVRVVYNSLNLMTDVRRWEANIRNVYNQFIMDTNIITAIDPSVDWYTTPIIGFSQWLTKVNGFAGTNTSRMQLNEGFQFRRDPNGAGFLYTEIPFEIIEADVTYNPTLQQALLTGTYQELGGFCNMSGTYIFRNFNQSDLLFPINHIAIQCLDLNYDPEDISVNTLDLEGTVVPSHMYFLKTFLISTRGGLSDFLYIEDSTTTNTIEVNSPRISRLQFRFLWIDSDQVVHNIELWENNVITLQLVLYPFEIEPAAKRVHFSSDS